MGQEIIFAKHRSNGFIVDLVRDGLGFGIENIRSVDKKDWERLRNEDNITSDKYAEVLDKVCRAIVREIFSIDDGQESKEDLENLSFFDALTKELLGYYSQYKSYFDTLGAGQKQLDFITISIFFVPFIAHAVSDSTTSSERDFKTKPFFIDRILPSDSKTSIMKVFELIEYDLAQNNPQKELRALIKKIFDNLKETNYDGINKNINNWLNGKNPPKLENIKHIAKVGEHCKDLSCRRIEIYLKLARIIQSAYDRACKYFGVDLANLLVEHFRLVTTIDNFEQSILQNNQPLNKNILHRAHQTKEILFIHSLYDCCLDRIKVKDKYIKGLDNREIKIFQIMQYPLSFTIVSEKDFIKHIDSFLFTKIFVPKNGEVSVTTDFETYHQSRLQSFLYPNKDETTRIKDDNMDYNDECLFYFNNHNIIEFLRKITEPTEIKQADDEKKAQELFKQLESNYNGNIDENPLICFLKARFYAQKLELDKANEFYLKALKYGKNVMGLDFRDIIKEGLMISAKLTNKQNLDLNNTKSDFTKFYKEAYFLNLITDLPDKKDFIQADFNRYILLKARIQFDEIFCNLYPSVENKLLESQNIIIDFAKPNKSLKIQWNSITQIMYSCLKDDIEQAKRLLSNGVNIDFLDDNNASVLHYCIRDFGGEDNNIRLLLYLGDLKKVMDYFLNISLSNGQIELARTLIKKASLKTLNARTILERQTILTRCIRWGLVDLVELLLDKNVDIEYKNCYKENHLPIIYCISCIWAAKNKAPNNHLDMYQGMASSDIKNYMRASSAFFDDEYKEALDADKEMQNNPIRNVVLNKWHGFYKQNLENYRKIAELIIDKMQNIDVRQENMENITPLIDATRVDEPILVKKLLAKGADKTLTLDDGRTAYHYAQKNHNLELMMLLRE